MTTIDSKVSLAIMGKMMEVFRSDDTFISFPITQIAYSSRLMGLVNEIAPNQEALQMMAEYSLIVNRLYNGYVAEFGSDELLWKVYEDVLTNARLASSILSEDEERRLQLSKQILYETNEDGINVPSAKYEAYQQYRDGYYNLVENIRNKKSELNLCANDDPDNKVLENELKILNEQLRLFEGEWIALGYKNEIELALNTMTSLSARSAYKIWEEWKNRFNPFTDMFTDLSGNRIAPTGYSPSNISELQSWQTFSLSKNEAAHYVNIAPQELKQRLSPNEVDLMIKRVSFQYISAKVMRPWFDSALFDKRFWKLSESCKQISDGQVPPRGRFPCYVTALVLAKDILIELDKDASQENQINLEKAQNKMDMMSFGMFTVPLKGLVANKQKLYASDIALKPQTRNFSAVPLQERKKIGRLLARPTHYSLDAMTTHRITTRNPVHSVAKPVFGMPVTALSRPLHAVGTVQPQLPPPIAPSSAAVDEDIIYILGFICKVLPKSPNPDEGLEWL